MRVALARRRLPELGVPRVEWAPWVLTALVAFLVVVPIAMLVLGSFSGARLPSDLSLRDLSLRSYASVYGDVRTYRVMLDTLVYVTGSMALGIGLGMLFAWLVTRTDMPGAWLGWLAIPLPLVLPAMLESMAWVLLFSPRIGFVNRFAIDALGLPSAPLDVYTLGGMIGLEAIRVVPTTFLLFAPLFRSFDTALEEAALMSGVGAWAVIRRITVPLLLPGILAIVVYQAVSVLSSFEVPGIIGLPGRVYVFSTLIFTYASAAAASGGSDYAAANALAMVYLVISVVGLVIYARATRNAARFAVVTGRGYRPRRVSLGRWRWAGLALLGAYAFVAFVLPLLVFAWLSLTPRILQPSLAALSKLTGRNWRAFLESADLVQVVGNTLVVIVATASIAVLLSLLVAWVTTRTRFSGRRILDQLAFASHGIPGVIMAIALIWFWVQVDLPIYGTLWVIVLGLVVGALAYGTRVTSAALLQVHDDLEHAAYVSGASPLRTVRRVFVPLLQPALAGLWIWVALHALRFVTLPLMLQTGPDNTVLSAYLWRSWENGEINTVATVGLAMIATVLALTLVMRRFGYGARSLGA